MWIWTRRLVIPALAGCAALTLIAASPSPSADAPVTPSAAQPAIFDVTVEPNPVRPNQPVSITIHTSPDVVLLQGHVFSHAFTVPKTGVGLFYGAGSVPWWARFFHGSIGVTFVATGAAGATAQFQTHIRM